MATSRKISGFWVLKNAVILLVPVLVLVVVLLLSGAFRAIAASSNVRKGGSLFSTSSQAPATVLFLNISFSKKTMENDDLWLECTLSGQGKRLANASLAVLCRSYPGRVLAGYSRLIGHTPSLGQYRYVPDIGCPAVFFLTFNPEAAPYDCYDSPKLVIGTDEEVSFFYVSLFYELPGGYAASLLELRRISCEELMEIAARTDNRLPEFISESGMRKYNYFLYVDFVVVRSPSQMALLTVYALSASYILYICSVLTTFMVPQVVDRLRIFSSVSVALFSFIWGFRQLLPSRVTYWEAALLVAMVAWGLLELSRRTKRDTTPQPIIKNRSENEDS